MESMLTHSYDNFWNKTESFEALRDYIVLNFNGLRDIITEATIQGDQAAVAAGLEICSSSASAMTGKRRNINV